MINAVLAILDVPDATCTFLEPVAALPAPAAAVPNGDEGALAILDGVVDDAAPKCVPWVPPAPKLGRASELLKYQNLGAVQWPPVQSFVPSPATTPARAPLPAPIAAPATVPAPLPAPSATPATAPLVAPELRDLFKKSLEESFDLDRKSVV